MLHSLEFWVAVGFVLLVLAIGRPVARGVGAMLDARADRIKATLEEAARLREEAQHLLAEYQRKQRDVAKEAEEMIAKAREEADRLAAEAVRNLETALARREALAHEKIAQAEADALREVREVAVEAAVVATRRLIREKLDTDRANVLIDEAISDLRGKLH